ATILIFVPPTSIPTAYGACALTHRLLFTHDGTDRTDRSDRSDRTDKMNDRSPAHPLILFRPRRRSPRQPAHLAGDLRLAARGASDRGEAERQAAQVLARVVDGLALLGDGTEQLPHRAVKAVGKPVSFQRWGCLALGRRKRY